MLEVTIQNEQVKATISQQAAEVISFKRLDSDIETIWCRDETYWKNCNPILFPYTSALIDGKYELDGQEYHLGQHGFARHATFDFEEIKKDSCRLSLTSNEETLKVYPFHFKLTVSYALEGSKLLLNYQIDNLDIRELPFNIGFHPAFNAPMLEGEKYEDYRIEFECEEDLSANFPDLKKVKEFNLGQYLPCNSYFFNDHSLKSTWSQLTNGIHTIRVGSEHFSTLGFWRKNEETPFMCIEPWYPDADLKKACTFRPDRENNLLPPQESFRCSYYFEIISL